ncbi:hypothetical protein PMAYCL1PPCAC_01672, partial [Pristionchus mayeri]
TVLHFLILLPSLAALVTSLLFLCKKKKTITVVADDKPRRVAKKYYPNGMEKTLPYDTDSQIEIHEAVAKKRAEQEAEKEKKLAETAKKLNTDVNKLLYNNEGDIVRPAANDETLAMVADNLGNTVGQDMPV